MSNFIEDPWASQDAINDNSSFKESNSKFDENNNDPRPILDLTDNLGNTINIFGDSSASSMMDSIIGVPDPLTYGTNNNWGDYNSSNILSNNANHSKTNTTDKTIGKLRNLNISSQSKFKSNSESTNPLAVFGTNNISTTNIQTNGDDNQDEIDDDNDDDLGVNEDELFHPIDVRIWSDEELQHFNPLSLKNSLDGIAIKVREIPEKEGLVFKHINYLISHTLKFGKEYNIPINDKSKNKTQQDNETKVIRRYSDFAWLVEVLWKKYPFRLIPELPPKKFASSSNDVMFLQKRRRGLQRFLYHLCKHPILSKENLVIMFLTVPNDFANWKKFANIELNDEFDGIRVNLPKRFKLDLSDILKGLRDTESDYSDDNNNNNNNGDDSNIHTTTTINNVASKSRNEFVINNINQIWNESPTKFKDKDYIMNVNKVNENLSKLAEIWSKLYLLVERIEKREVALSSDHQRFAIFLQSMIKVDTEIFSMDNLVSNKSNQVDDETQNMTVINSVLNQISKYFVGSRKLKEQEMLIINSQILESWKNFHDYLISLHFLIERFFNYKIESEKEIQNLLQKIMRTNERIKQLKMKSDIRGSEVDKHIDILTKSMGHLSMLISRIILVKTTFVNEFKLFQKVKYFISEVFQDWFDQRSKYSELQNDYIQRLLNDLKDMPLGS